MARVQCEVLGGVDCTSDRYRAGMAKTTAQVCRNYRDTMAITTAMVCRNLALDLSEFTAVIL